MTKRKFHKTVVTVTILSEVPYDVSALDECGENSNKFLDQVSYDITAGHCSGDIDVKTGAPVSGKKMAQMLIKQGSAPEVFGLTEDGEDLEAS